MTTKETNLQKLDQILKQNTFANDLFDVITKSTDPDETRLLLRDYTLCLMHSLELYR